MKGDYYLGMEGLIEHSEKLILKETKRNRKPISKNQVIAKSNSLSVITTIDKLLLAEV